MQSEHSNKSKAEQQAELSIIEFYIDIAETRIQEIQTELDNGTVTGQGAFVAHSIAQAYSKRLIQLRQERQEIRWQMPMEATS